jgi:hypothetical protein
VNELAGAVWQAKLSTAALQFAEAEQFDRLTAPYHARLSVSSSLFETHRVA